MSVIFWLLIIPGGIITYIIVGILVNILLCVAEGQDWRRWRRELQDEDTIEVIIFWPFVLVLAFILLPVAALQWILEKIAEK